MTSPSVKPRQLYMILPGLKNWVPHGKALYIIKFKAGMRYSLAALWEHSFYVLTPIKHFPEDFCLNDVGLLLIIDDFSALANQY